MAYVFAFITLFAAIDVIGVLPIYHALTADSSAEERQRILRQSCLTAFFVALGFALLGRFVFRLLGIEVYDFKVAGGLLLFVFSLQDLLGGEKVRRKHSATLGVVPIGMPLIVGPAVLTTIVILLDTYGHLPTLVALVVNLVVVYATLLAAPALLRRLGPGGAKALGKIASLLLAAIGVMMVRRGIFEMVRAGTAAVAPAPH
jgi:multiple antibiotic resistance protein